MAAAQEIAAKAQECETYMTDSTKCKQSAHCNWRLEVEEWYEKIAGSRDSFERQINNGDLADKK